MNKHFKTSLTTEDIEGAGRVVAWITRQAHNDSKVENMELNQAVRELEGDLDKAREVNAHLRQELATKNPPGLANAQGVAVALLEKANVGLGLQRKRLQNEIAALRKDGMMAFNALDIAGEPRPTNRKDMLYRRALRAGKLHRTTRKHLRKARKQIVALEKQLDRSKLVTRETQRQYDALLYQKRGWVPPSTHYEKVNSLTSEITRLSNLRGPLARTERDAWRLRAFQIQGELLTSRGKVDIALQGRTAAASHVYPNTPDARRIAADVDDQLFGIMEYVPGKTGYSCRGGATNDGVTRF